MTNVDNHVKVLTHVADTISAGAILGTFLGILPPLAAFAAFFWYLIQIWESHTVQKWWRLHTRQRRTTRVLRRRKWVKHHVRKLRLETDPPELHGTDHWHM